jgi:SAM-dependent methyltransferase
MDQTPGDVYRVTRDDEYLRRLQEEAAYWDRPHFFSHDTQPPLFDEYFNERFAGKRSVAWFETIPAYGTFRRGCALGAGGLKHETRILEQNPSLHLTVYDISRESLAKRERELAASFPGRVATQEVDLNFVELPEDTYDLIISAGSMHHLLNLEHIAYQIARSLTPQGFFFLEDYVGETRFQFAAEKKRLFEAAFEEARARHPYLRFWRVAWPELSPWKYSPSEAVRSGESLAIFSRYLTEVERREAGAILTLLLWLRPVLPPARASIPGWRRRLHPFVAGARRALGLSQPATVADVIARVGPELLWLDRAISDAGILQPAVAFAVYQRRRPGEQAHDSK